ncbi:unnamed protein product [Tetraodon nigroviridis]|uniref:(spotted green pufferfish) hypothetical protein n=1 Tax=Tetraodon nigroviridis TaxID=99883 RepID=Q4RLL3_TETNG|nr:unnamed protein product [Tetraodon nigroviridis]
MMASRKRIHRHENVRTSTQILSFDAEVLSLLALQPAQSSSQGVAALLLALSVVLLLGKNIHDILGNQIPTPQ